MKAFLTDALLPFVAVTLTVAILTLAIFDPPPRVPLEKEPVTLAHGTNEADAGSISRDEPAAASQPAPIELGQSAPPRGRTERERVEKEKAMQDMNEIFARALRNMSFERPAPGTLQSPTEQLDPNLPTSLQKLGQAIQAARNARTEQDLVEAEKMLKSAREHMEQTCGKPGSPLCQSAKSIKELGY